jgi:outer membrane murein-binding lipoprotein Lpp
VGWVVGGAWIGAAVFALLVLAFCAYEVAWKAKRLRTAQARLQELVDQFGQLQADLAAARQRATDRTG